jgi:hypothetical protein
MHQKRGGILISFPAMRHVALETESIIKATRFTLRAGDKLFAKFLEGIEFCRVVL